mgnify:CR=1 FL=1
METFKQCPACKNELQDDLDFCDVCDFPFKGSEKEKGIHIGRFINKKGVVFDADESLNKSQYLIYIVVALFVLGMVINFQSLILNPFILGFNLAICLVLVASAILIKKSPLLFTTIPLVILLLLYIGNYIIDPRSLVNGILFKLIIIGSLIYSIYMHVSSNRFKKKYNISEEK